MSLDKKLLGDPVKAKDMNPENILTLLNHLDKRITYLEKDINLKLEQKFSELYRNIVFLMMIPILLQIIFHYLK